MDVSVKPESNFVSVMLTPPTSQKGVAPPLPAPPLSSPGHGWHLVRDHNVTRYEDGFEAFQHRDHSVHPHHGGMDREDNVGYHHVDEAHLSDDVSPPREDDLGGSPSNSSRPPLQANAHGLAGEQQLFPLSLLKEALAPLCLRLAAVEAGLEQLLLHIPMLMMQGGGAISKSRARRSPTKGVTPCTVTTPPVSSYLTCTSPQSKPTASLTTPSIPTCCSKLATATPSLATGKPSNLMCTLPLATRAPCHLTHMLPLATGTHSLATGIPSHQNSRLPPATATLSQASERATHLTCGSDLATGTPFLAPGLPSLSKGSPSLAMEMPPLTMEMSSLRNCKLPFSMNSLQTTRTEGFSTKGEGLKYTEELGREGEEPANRKRKWSFNGGHLDLREPAEGVSHLASGESAGLSSGQWKEVKVCKKRRGCRDFPMSCPSSSVVSSIASIVPAQRSIPPLHHSGNMLLPCGQSRLPLSHSLSKSVSSPDHSQSWPSGSTHHFMFVGDYPVCRTCPVDHCPPGGLSLVQNQKSRARSRQNISGSHSELHSKPVPLQSETSTTPSSQSKTSSTPPGQSETFTPSTSQSEDLISWLLGSSFPISQSCFLTLRAPRGQSLTTLPIKQHHISMTTGRLLRPLHALRGLSPVAIETVTRCLLATAGQWPPRPPLRDRTAPCSLENDHSYGQRAPPLSSSVRSLSKCARQLKRSGAPANEQASIKATSPSQASALGGRQQKTGEVKRVSEIRIRKSMPKQDAELTPMGLPRPKRLKKKEFSLEEIYTNQNYRSPSNNSLETIFEEPRERGGRVLCMAHQKRPRLLNFSHTSRPRRRRLGQAGSGLISTSSMTSSMRSSAVTRRRCRANGGLTDDEDADVRLVERLSALEDFLSRSGLDVV